MLTVKNLNQRVLEAVSKPESLDMSDWHTCETTHCWAGWIVHLAGEKGYELENQMDTPFAAMQIFKASNGYSVNPAWFYLNNDQAREKIKQLAGE